MIEIEYVAKGLFENGIDVFWNQIDQEIIDKKLDNKEKLLEKICELLNEGGFE